MDEQQKQKIFVWIWDQFWRNNHRIDIGRLGPKFIEFSLQKDKRQTDTKIHPTINGINIDTNCGNFKEFI